MFYREDNKMCSLLIRPYLEHYYIYIVDLQYENPVRGSKVENKDEVKFELNSLGSFPVDFQSLM